MFKKVLSTVLGLYNNGVSALGVFGGVLIVGIAFLSAWDVIARKAFRAPLIWAQEISEYLLLISVFLTLALSWRENRHVRVDILYERLRPRWRIRANYLFSLWAFLFCAALTWYGFTEAREALLRGEFSVTIMAIPTFPVKVFVPIGAFLLCIQIVYSSIKSARSETSNGSHD